MLRSSDSRENDAVTVYGGPWQEFRAYVASVLLRWAMIAHARLTLDVARDLAGPASDDDLKRYLTAKADAYGHETNLEAADAIRAVIADLFGEDE